MHCLFARGIIDETAEKYIPESQVLKAYKEVQVSGMSANGNADTVFTASDMIFVQETKRELTLLKSSRIVVLSGVFKREIQE